MERAFPDQIILNMARTSPLVRREWTRRGRAPVGYIMGMSAAFAMVYRKLRSADPVARAMAMAETGNPAKDALTWCRPLFFLNGMSNGESGADTLRHLFVFMVGLGMRESSGWSGAGLDKDANKDGKHPPTALNAEAGLFQVSYSSIGANSLLRKLFQDYRGRTDLQAVFSRGNRRAASPNVGAGSGAAFQHLMKTCPAFAVQYTGVALRWNRRHWGPVNRRTVDVSPHCDELLHRVQDHVDCFG
ncbi:hypothetical protein [Muricoccus radiodurans]|uniref:hypothetical protein n=1 Tax=Muricoccus radiodurans TaxID=2231721 RepID=UPI003CFB842B